MPDNFSEFHFLRPGWLLLVLPLAFLCWRLLRRRNAAGIWQSICDEALLPFLLVQRTVSRSPVNLGVFLLSGVIAILALAGPTWERLPTPVFRDESALVLLLDLSRSMDAADISPSRLERAKFKITDILRQRRDGQTALIVYAAEPYVVTPLTNDVATIESQLPALRTGIMPSQGSAGASAVEKGIELLGQGGMTSGDLLLVTDGLGLAELERAKKLIAGTAVRLSILGVGTEEGAPIPDKNGGFITDARGSIVLEPLRPSQLRKLANTARGVYQSVRTDDKDIAVFLSLIEQKLDQRNAATTDQFADRWRELGPWLLLGLIPLAPLAFRRGLLSVTMAAGVAAASISPPANAGWWETPDQAAYDRFEQGDFAAAAEQFDNPAWRASANYRAGNYEDAAAQVPEQADGSPDGTSADSQYNTGNALARLGRFEEAIAAYDQTLTQRPNHEDALHNKALLEELLEQQREQKQEQQSDSSDDSESNDESGQSGGEASDSQASDTPSDSASEDQGEPSEEQNEQSESTTSSDQKSDESAEAQESEQPSAEPEIGEEEREAEPDAEAQAEANSEMENEQATEQWLRQIPDDPGGLLRRKFEYEYQKKYGRGATRPQAW